MGYGLRDEQEHGGGELIHGQDSMDIDALMERLR